MSRDIDSLLSELAMKLPPKRYSHTLAVRDQACALAKKWYVDERRVELAALLHDCARGLSESELLDTAERLCIKLTASEVRNPVLVHAPVGAVLARIEYGVDDDIVCRAIRYHTTACEDMDDVGKVIYLADFISDDRDFEGVDDIRLLAYSDMARALVSATKSTLVHLLNMQREIHPDTISFWNSLVSTCAVH